MTIALIIITVICTCSMVVNICLGILTFMWMDEWVKERREKRLSQEEL